MKSGEALAGGGAVLLLMMSLAGFLVARVEARALMACGFLSIALALFHMSRTFNNAMDFGTMFQLRIFQTMGLAFIFVPQNTLAYVGVPREKNNQISSMNSFLRNVGGSIGIALLSSSIVRFSQQRRNDLVAHANQGSPQFQNILGAVTQNLHHQGASNVDARRQAYGIISGVIQSQATTQAYVEILGMLALVVAFLTPLLLLMKGSKASKPDEIAVH